MKNNLTVSLVVPCYNEETNIQKGVLDKIGNYTQSLDYFSEVLIVDDGSTDQSKIIIKNKYLKLFPKFRLIENNHAGKAYAVISGIKKANGKYILFCDFDLATPIEEFEKLIGKVSNDIPIVIGSRNKDRKDAPFFRKIMSSGSVIVKSLIIGMNHINDTQCGFKLFKKDVALDILNSLRVFHNNRKIHGASVSAGFDLEFLFVAIKKKYRIIEVPVEWKYAETRRVDFLKDTYESLRDILSIKYYDLTQKYR